MALTHYQATDSSDVLPAGHPMETETVQAAGAVLWRRIPGGRIVVALVHRPKYDDWSLPKGKLEPGEHALTAAAREVREETGHAVTLGRPLPTQHYRISRGGSAGRPKEVRYWAGRATGGGFTPSAEVDALVWLDVHAAAGRLTRAADVDTLAAFTEGPPATATVLVLRHAQALPRDSWSGPDNARPLRADGRTQAGALVPLLAAYGPARLLSSPALRCTTTLDPLARASGLPVESVPGFGEDGTPGGTDRALGLLRTLVAGGEPVVVCSHRPVLPAVLAALGTIGPPGASGPLAPSEFLAVHLAELSPVAVERHCP